MNKQALLKAALLISLLAPAKANAQTSGRADGMRFVPDVPDQFAALAERADPFGLHLNGSPNPSSCKHYQGVVRVQGADGTPFLLVSRSGNLPDFFGSGTGCNDSPGETHNGHLIVFRMGSRGKHGERLRSNRLSKGVHVNDTKPNDEDKATAYFTVTEDGLVAGAGEGDPPPKVFQHPGGMQVVGDVLALAVEAPRQTGRDDACSACSSTHLPDDCERCFNYQSASSPTMVMFFDVSDPEAPMLKSRFPLVDEDGASLGVAGTVAINPLPPAPGETEGRYLMMVTGGRHNPSLYFYRSSSTNLKDENLSWTFVDVWRAHTGRTEPGLHTCSAGSVEDARGFCLSPDEQYLEQNWPDGNDGHTHQTLQFLREGDINGTLYLAGARGKFDSETSTLDLYRVDCETPLCDAGSEIRMKRIVTRDLLPHPNTGGEQLVSLAAASTFYVSPGGELLFYATEHDNDGPAGTVKAGEWRHRDVVRENSPTYLPTATVNGPYEVDEGGEVVLDGSAEPPITKAWIQLFHGTAFHSFYPLVEYKDHDLDDFDDFFTLEFLPRPFQPPFTHNDKARSWTWFAPAGCSIAVFDRQASTSRILAGTGFVERVADLSQDFGDMYEKVDAVDFLPDCDQRYYAEAFTLRWDLDLDGSYETDGSPVTFNAAAFDGPSVVNIPAEARHPSGGPAGQATAKVTVRNVAPQLTPLLVTDGAGRRVNVDVPFVLTNLPVTVGASFGDPGVLDRQTAMLAWGDGAVEPQTAFTSFDEAFGDATGSASHTHRYPLAGSYQIALSVADDDGGADTEASVVRVLTPEQAVEEIIGMLDGVIAGTTNDSVRQDLEQARKALAGSNDQSNNGALDMIRAGNEPAATAFLQQSIAWLRRAQAGGADAATQIVLLEQVLAALSAA